MDMPTMAPIPMNIDDLPSEVSLLVMHPLMLLQNG